MTPQQTMVCISCGKEKHWRDGFPNSILAECWQCVWTIHFELHHPPTKEEIRKAKKKALEQFKQQNIKEIQKGKMKIGE